MKKLFIVTSPSGGGKTSVIKLLMKRHGELIHSISCTTRAMRPGEVNGEYYHHISRQEFEDGIKAGKFAEWARVHNEIYGTPKGPLDKWLNEGKIILLDLDVVGSLNLKKIYGSKAATIFLLPPSLKELKMRLVGRATDSKEVQELRLKNALEELTHKDQFDYRIVNDKLELACDEIEKIIYATT